MRRTTFDRQRRRALADAATTATTPVEPTGPTSGEARAFRDRHGSPSGWTALVWKAYFDLGGGES